MVLARRRSSVAWLFSLSICVVMLLADEALALNVTDLGHLSWTLTNAPHHSEHSDELPCVNVSVSASLPGTVHGALRDAGVLPESPLIGFNEQRYRWVALSNWTYSTTLDVSKSSLLTADALDLILHGVDTFATVVVNGLVVATLDNSFVRHVVPLNYPSSPIR